MARILFLIVGCHKPSSRKRVLDSLDYINSRGHKADVAEIPAGFPGQLSLLGRLGRYDLVVIQKKLFSPVMLDLMRRVNPNLVFDFDDAVMFLEVERGEPIDGRFFRRFACTARACRGFIAGNEYLAGFIAAARKKAVVLPTPVDTDAITPGGGARGGKVVIGWMGTKGNLKHLKWIEEPLKAVLEDCPEASLRVVSNARPETPGLALEYKPWSKDAEVEDLRGFDVGLMPLMDNIWTRGKGGYKLLQYMAAGVPAVASPVGINADIIEHGRCGFLARSESDWSGFLKALIKDEALRIETGRSGRKMVEESYSLSGYNRRLLDTLEKFLK